jgi:two-component system, LytTR family, sensor kinase
MKSKYPIEKLTTFNLWLSSYFFLLGFVTAMASVGFHGMARALLYSFFGAITALLNSFLNLALLLFLEKYFSHNILNKKIGYLILSFIFSIVLYIFITYIYSRFNPVPAKAAIYIFSIIICFLINTMVIALQNYVIMLDAKAAADIENSKLKAANADASNQLLRQQINPHFLFNALNILKSLYKNNPVSGEEYLIRLSDFLRASVSNNNIKVICLKDEIKLCTDYMEMQKIRFGEALQYKISIYEETLKYGFVPSFSIQPLLENAIKHNELTEENPLKIQIRQVGDRILVLNNLKPKTSSEVSTGSGLSNLSERYRLLSNDELIIENSENMFSVSIKILSHENSNNRR